MKELVLVLILGVASCTGLATAGKDSLGNTLNTTLNKVLR